MQSTDHVDDQELAAVVNEGITLVNFGVSLSLLCNMQNAISHKIAQVFKGYLRVLNVDTDCLPQAKSRWQVENFPTLLIMKNGEQIKRFEGLQSEETLAQELVATVKSFPRNINQIIQASLQQKKLEKTVFRKSILLIDDDPDVTFCVRTVLEEANFRNIRLADDYRAAIEQLANSKPDLLFINLEMRDRQGHKIMRDIGKNNSWRSIPILISLTPLEPTRVYEATFRNATVLKHGKYIEQPKHRHAFIHLVKEMLLYKEKSKQSQMLHLGAICPSASK